MELSPGVGSGKLDSGGGGRQGGGLQRQGCDGGVDCGSHRCGGGNRRRVDRLGGQGIRDRSRRLNIEVSRRGACQGGAPE